MNESAEAEEGRTPDHHYDCDEDGPQYVPPDAVFPGQLYENLSKLVFLSSDPFLRMQAFSLDMIDQFIMTIEYEVLKEWHEMERTPARAHFLNAQSQMWVLSAYELIRTWRELVKDIRKLHQNGGFPNKIASLRAQALPDTNIGVEARIEQLELAVSTPNLISEIDGHLAHTHVPFGMLEFHRINLAKNQTSGRPNLVPQLPMGRINKECGSLDFELSIGDNIIGQLNRRQIADSFRYLNLSSPAPDSEDLKSFDASLKPPRHVFR